MCEKGLHTCMLSSVYVAEANIEERGSRGGFAKCDCGSIEAWTFCATVVRQQAQARALGKEHLMMIKMSPPIHANSKNRNCRKLEGMHEQTSIALIRSKSKVTSKDFIEIILE